MRIGIFGGDTAGRTIDEIIRSAREAEEAGFASYSIPQIFGFDAITILSIIGREVPRIELGTGVVPTYTRHPAVLAQQALTAQAACGGRFVLGVGLSHKWVIEEIFGYSFDAPVGHLREYLSILIPLLQDRSVTFAGDTLSAQIGIDVGTVPAPPVLVAALGPQMLRVVGTLADGTVTWMTGPRTLADHTIPTITRAAEAAGRPAPKVVVALPVCVTDDVAAARERATLEFGHYGMLPSYRAMLDREGAAGPADVAIVGDAAAIGDTLERLREIGVTDFIAALFGSRDDHVRTSDALRRLL